MYVCMCACTHIWCTWMDVGGRAENNLKCHYSRRLSITFETGSLIGLKCISWTGLPTQKTKRSPCLHSTGITNTYNHARYFYVGSSRQTQVLPALGRHTLTNLATSTSQSQSSNLHGGQCLTSPPQRLCLEPLICSTCSPRRKNC